MNQEDFMKLTRYKKIRKLEAGNVEGEIIEAEDLLKKAIDLGKKYLEDEKIENEQILLEVLSFFRTAYEIESENVEIITNYAFYLSRLAKLKSEIEKKELLREAIKLAVKGEKISINSNIYNLACYQAMLGNKDVAIEILISAIQIKYVPAMDLMVNDEDLKNIIKDKRLKEYLDFEESENKRIKNDLIIEENEQYEQKFLDSIEELDGNLELFECNLEGKFGLEKLKKINGRFCSCMTWITEFKFDALEEVEGDFIIEFEDCIENLNDFNNLKKVKGDLRIIGGDHLNDLEGFENLEEIGGSLIIHYRDRNIKENFLKNLKKINGNLRIEESEINIMETFKNLKEIGGKIIVGENSEKFEFLKEICKNKPYKSEYFG